MGNIVQMFCFGQGGGVTVCQCRSPSPSDGRGDRIPPRAPFNRFPTTRPFLIDISAILLCNMADISVTKGGGGGWKLTVNLH